MSYFRLSSSKPLVGFSIALDIIVLDQLSKWLVLEYVIRKDIQPHGRPSGLIEWLIDAPGRLPPTAVEILPFFNLVMVWNEGISFGLFDGSMVWLLIGLAAAITVFFGIWLTRVSSWFQTVCIGMVIGGAIGNMLDRLRFGAVADFLDFHAFGWHYPAFNVADCGITIGIVLLVIDGIFFEPKRNKAENGMTA